MSDTEITFETFKNEHQGKRKRTRLLIPIFKDHNSKIKELREKAVFIDGAVISLYTDDDLAADEICPTKDIDMTTINLANYIEGYK